MYFPSQGKACSILDLIRRCKEWTASTQPVQPMDVSSKTMQSSLYSIDELIAKIRDCFYKSGKNIKEIFNSGSTDAGYVDEEAFVFI